MLLSPAIPAAANDEGSDPGHESSGGFNLDTQRTWLFRSFLPDESDDADVLGLEFNSSWSWGSYDWTNISYIELADYPVGVPATPSLVSRRPPVSMTS